MPPGSRPTPTTGLVGFRRGANPVEVGVLVADTSGGVPKEVIPLTDLKAFWADPFGAVELVESARQEHEAVEVKSVTIVPPILPSARIFCVGLNYHDHVAEGTFANDEPPRYPTLFARWPASLTVGGNSIPVPLDEEGLDWEAEVMAYVGRPLREVDSEAALSSVVGYSTFNDVTARRAQKLTSQWILGKNADRSGPLGPLVPASEVGDLRDGLSIEARVNGTVVQSASTASMIYSVGDTLAHISRTVTLQPGDLLATGTPSGVGYARTPPWLMGPGDRVEVEVEKLGVLRNSITDGTRDIDSDLTSEKD